MTNHYRCAPLAHVSKRFSGQAEIVPGVVGHEEIIDPRPALLTPGLCRHPAGFRFDPRQRRCVCHDVWATRSTGGPVTTEVLRDVQIAHWIVLALLISSDEGPVIRELENPDGKEPWGKTAPDSVADHGADRSSAAVDGSFRPVRLRVSYNPSKAVQESLQMPRSVR